MTLEEFKDTQKRYTADFLRRAYSCDENEREQAVAEAIARLKGAGILDQDGELAAHYR